MRAPCAYRFYCGLFAHLRNAPTFYGTDWLSRVLQVLVKVVVRGLKDPVVLSMPFNITNDPKEAIDRGLTEEQLESATVFPVTFGMLRFFGWGEFFLVL